MSYRHLVRLKAGFFLPFFGLLMACAHHPQVRASCDLGIYGNEREIAVVYDREMEPGERTTRYTFVDGRRGVIGDAEAALQCVDGQWQTTPRAALREIQTVETDTVFRSGELNLAGRLIEPVREADHARPLVVFVHGSESTPTVGNSYYPLLLAAQGVSVFVYDKRGTGQSEGSYTQNFELLASDVVAAAAEARRLATGRYERFGLFGGSQGGWVAPLAANRAGAEFLVIGFGLVLSPLEEDAEQVYDELRRAGYGEDVLADARAVTRATGEIVGSHFTSGFEALVEVKARFGGEVWFQSIEGEFTGDILRASETGLRRGVAGDFEDSGVLWRHDPIAVLRTITVPQLWVIAANDTAAPGLVTQERLASLQAEGFPITTALYPNTDHGMVEFEQLPDGSRRYTQFTEGYFRLIADTMLDIRSPPYGRADIRMPIED
ncbi:alpha/beta hydrolase family protein [Parasphingopyxis lamellibrachiae]|nr:alpha/beta hydrolase [Parasphingopyxis lamellibrachiae]